MKHITSTAHATLRGGEEIPAGTFHGGEEIPAGTFHGGEEIPAGTFHSVIRCSRCGHYIASSRLAFHLRTCGKS